MRRLLPIGLLVLLASSSVAAKDFRGILPMHSTREDVIAILGPPTLRDPLQKHLLNYTLDEGEVYILVADEDAVQRNNCKALAAGTVLSIQLTPKDRLLVSSLNLDEKIFRKFDPSRPQGIGFEGFIDDKEGLVIRAYEGKVQQMIYFASAADRARCPGYLENPETLVEIMRCGLISNFDEYGDISFADERARLDNFAIQIQNSGNMDALIVVYAGRRARVAEAQIRGNRARNYLINVRKIDPQRIKVIDAGHREDLTVTLYIWPAGADSPEFASMFDKSEVQIIYEKKKRTARKQP